MKILKLALIFYLFYQSTKAQSSSSQKYIKRESYGVELSTDSGQNLIFYEGQLLEMGFYVSNKSASLKKFIFGYPIIQKIQGNSGEIMLPPDYEALYEFKQNKEEFYSKDSVVAALGTRLVVEAGKRVPVSYRSFTLAFFGNTDLVDYVAMSKSEKATFGRYFPKFLKHGKYVITFRFYVEPYDKFIELDVPIQVLPATGRIKKQQQDYMNALWEGIKVMRPLDSIEKANSKQIGHNPLYVAMKKDTATVYASDLLYPMILDITYMPSFTLEMNNIAYVFQYFELLPHLTGFRSPIVLSEFYNFYGKHVVKFLNAKLIQSEHEYLYNYVRRSENLPKESVNQLIKAVITKHEAMIQEYESWLDRENNKYWQKYK